VSAAFDIQASSDLGDELREALAAADSVHLLGGDIVRIPIRASSESRLLGHYQYDTRTNEPSDIAVSEYAADPQLTVLHEIGHYIDHSLITPRGVFASTSAICADWREAVLDSGAVARLVAMYQDPQAFEVSLPDGTTITPNRSEIAYLLETEEAFARSYAQYIVSRSGTEPLVKELAEARGLFYPEQWDDPDFAPIASALDELLERQGWRT
jgi:hypothetical protein